MTLRRYRERIPQYVGRQHCQPMYQGTWVIHKHNLSQCAIVSAVDTDWMGAPGGGLSTSWCCDSCGDNDGGEHSCFATWPSMAVLCASWVSLVVVPQCVAESHAVRQQLLAKGGSAGSSPVAAWVKSVQVRLRILKPNQKITRNKPNRTRSLVIMVLFFVWYECFITILASSSSVCTKIFGV